MFEINIFTNTILWTNVYWYAKLNIFVLLNIHTALNLTWLQDINSVLLFSGNDIL